MKEKQKTRVKQKFPSTVEESEEKNMTLFER